MSKYAKSKSEKASGESAVVDYTCVSKPKSEKKIYVILKNYHGDYWKTVIEGIERAAKEIDAGVYLGGIDNETDIDGQISLMEKAVKEGADGILLAPANSNSLVDSCEKVRKKKDSSCFN
ncbi:substrate-binding domain-containing protein [Anaerobutyricum hallii]|nr:substrate-binding domain-containing protein [Anaerobutyricum hallii]